MIAQVSFDLQSTAPDNPRAQAILEARWGVVVDASRATLQRYTEGHAQTSSLSHAVGQALFVSGVVVTNQTALPLAQERSGMFTGAGFAEVIHHGPGGFKHPGRVGPEVGPVRLSVARLEHLHRRFIGVQYRLDESRVAVEYVEALFGQLKTFLLRKQPGHCQRVDYLPAAVLARLGERLSADGDLTSKGIVCQVLCNETDGSKLRPWESTGSGAVALREDATYGRVKVFCALFPAGIRLAEEDSLNVATFKTDDADSFDIRKSVQDHLFALIGDLTEVEQTLLRAVLNAEAVRPREIVAKLRYLISVLGERERSNRPVSWESAGAYLYEVQLIPADSNAPVTYNGRPAAINRRS